MLIQNLLQEGTWVDNYRIVRKLGRGGFGITYLAEEYAQSEGGGASGQPLREVALKEYFPRGIATRPNGHTVAPVHDVEGAEQAFRHGLKAFFSEAQALAQLDHENIVHIHRVFERNGTAYFVMPFLKGESLRSLLRREGTLSEERARRLLLPVLNGLAYAHARGILHRDIKPDNVMIRENDGRPVLIDFGTARAETADDSQQYTRHSELVAYTPGYAAFEQYGRASRQNLHGPHTDVYSFAAMLYEAIAGEAPIESAARVAEMHDDKEDPLVPASARLLDTHGYSRAFLAAVDWGLEVIAKDRPQSLADLRKALDGKLAIPGKTLQRIERHGAPGEAFTQPGVGSVPAPPTTQPQPQPSVAVSSAGFRRDTAPSHAATTPASIRADSRSSQAAPAASPPHATTTIPEAAPVVAQNDLRRHAPLIGGGLLALLGLLIALLGRRGPAPQPLAMVQPPGASTVAMAPKAAATAPPPATAATPNASPAIEPQPAVAAAPKPPAHAARPSTPKPHNESPSPKIEAEPSAAQFAAWAHLWGGRNISTSSARREERLSPDQCTGQPLAQIQHHEMEGARQIAYGQVIKLYVYFRYCGDTEIKGRMHWRVLYRGQQMIADDDSQSLERGDYRTAMKVKAPDNAPIGRYIMETSFEGASVPIIDSTEFFITGKGK